MGHNLLVKLVRSDHDKPNLFHPLVQQERVARTTKTAEVMLETPSSKHQPKICPQPTFKTIEGHVQEIDYGVMERSVIGITEEPTITNMLIEKLLTEGISTVSIKGISHVKFLITFEDVEMKQKGIDFLRFLFINLKEAILLDSIVPRIAWIYVDGLPIFSWNREIWKRIIGDWGHIISGSEIKSQDGMFFNPKICIQTYKVIEIDETIKVTIKGLGYWVRIEELTHCFDSKEFTNLVEATKGPSKSFSTNTPSPTSRMRSQQMAVDMGQK